MSLHELYQNKINNPSEKVHPDPQSDEDKIKEWLENIKNALLTDPKYVPKLEEIKNSILNSANPQTTFLLFKYWSTL